MLFRVSAFSCNEALAAASCTALLALLGAPHSDNAASCSPTPYRACLTRLCLLLLHHSCVLQRTTLYVAQMTPCASCH
jgi:hypothetical protein